ncbi:streptococcal hemagglutinin-like isoform X2 [Lytechinus pictus]|uniref:streptococcal hemagglutinin-like isoform X2 n=1 Tax=Lytechinus pictus TaxID=7653 RepID=UPI0030B9D103
MAAVNDPWMQIVANIGLGAFSHPMGYVKTLIQLGYEPLPPRLGRNAFFRECYQLPGFFPYVRHIYRVDGFTGLYRGFFPALCQNFIAGGVVRSVTEKLDELFPVEDESEKKALAKKRPELASVSFHTFMLQMSKDSVAHFCAVVVTQPFNVVMVRSMAQFIGRETKYRSSSSAVTDDAIYEDDDPVKDDIPHSRSSLSSVAANANYMHDTVHDLLDDDIPQYSNQSATTSRPLAASDSSTRNQYATTSRPLAASDSSKRNQSATTSRPLAASDSSTRNQSATTSRPLAASDSSTRNQSATTSRPLAASDSSTRFEENQRSVTPAKRNSTSQGQGRKKAKMTAEEVLIEISKEEHALRMKSLQEEHQLKIQMMREEHALKMEIMNLEKSTLEVKYKEALDLTEKED